MKLSELIAELLECQAILKERYSVIMNAPEYLDPLVTIVHEGVTNEVISIEEVYLPSFGDDRECRLHCTDDLMIGGGRC